MKKIQVILAVLCVSVFSACTPESVEPLSLQNSEASSNVVTHIGITSVPFDDGKPLVIVDGVTVSQEEFMRLDPNQVEAVHVVKGIKSTAIYGTRGENGVIIVTTKK